MQKEEENSEMLSQQFIKNSFRDQCGQNNVVVDSSWPSLQKAGRWIKLQLLK